MDKVEMWGLKEVCMKEAEGSLEAENKSLNISASDGDFFTILIFSVYLVRLPSLQICKVAEVAPLSGQIFPSKILTKVSF